MEVKEEIQTIKSELDRNYVAWVGFEKHLVEDVVSINEYWLDEGWVLE